MSGGRTEESEGLEENIKKMYRDQGQEISDKEAKKTSDNLVNLFKCFDNFYFLIFIYYELRACRRTVLWLRPL